MALSLVQRRRTTIEPRNINRNKGYHERGRIQRGSWHMIPRLIRAYFLR